MFQGFKEFILRGNVVDLAVAVIIGAAFGAIITALVEYIVNPLIGAFVPTGDLSSWTITIPGLVADAELGIGGIISAIISFLAIALVVYLTIVIPMNKVAERRAAGAPAEEIPPTSEELLAEIRDLLAEKNAR